jgi:ribosomal protein S18 acetylase RimI-like enzyme
MIRPPRPDERDALARLVDRIDQFNQEERAVALELIDEALTKPETTYRLLVATGGLTPPTPLDNLTPPTPLSMNGEGGPGQRSDRKNSPSPSMERGPGGEVAGDPPSPSMERGPGGEVLGYLCYGATPMTDTTADLYWIATDPAARGTGLGKALHAALVDVLSAEGRVWIRVETSSQDDYNGTVAFYERLGYETVSRIKDFYRAGDDLITMFYRVEGA